jgi:hypothetical protein
MWRYNSFRHTIRVRFSRIQARAYRRERSVNAFVLQKYGPVCMGPDVYYKYLGGVDLILHPPFASTPQLA